VDIVDVTERLEELAELLEGFDVVVDAVGGTGIKGALRGAMATAVEQINAAHKPVVSVDIPTGLDCDTGAAESPAVKARITVTFAVVKVGFGADGAQAYTGQVRVADIGIPAERLHRMQR
jgi:NAD(P)H-hydrate epimerase